jgi:hypothetical protein
MDLETNVHRMPFLSAIRAVATAAAFSSFPELAARPFWVDIRREGARLFAVGGIADDRYPCIFEGQRFFLIDNLTFDVVFVRE